LDLRISCLNLVEAPSNGALPDGKIAEILNNHIAPYIAADYGENASYPSIQDKGDVCSKACFLRELRSEVDWSWKDEKGVKLNKRISKLIYRTLGLRMPKELIDSIGNIAGKAASTGDLLLFRFWPRFDWGAGDFGDPGSCHFKSRDDLPPWLEENGYMALQFFVPPEAEEIRKYASGTTFTVPNDDEREYLFNRGIARSIAFHDEKRDALILINAYGTYELVRQVTFISHWLALPSKRIGVHNCGSTGGSPYINNGVGYVVGAEDVISRIERYDYNIPFGIMCDICDTHVDEDDIRHAGDQRLCDRCFDEYYRYCERCEEVTHVDEGTYCDSIGQWYCEDCTRNFLSLCGHCDEYHLTDDLTYHSGSDVQLCEYCESKATISVCESCEESFVNSSDFIMTVDTGELFCPSCAEDELVCCDECKEPYSTKDSLIKYNHNSYCEECYDAYYNGQLELELVENEAV
jgi:hypothetical protein